MTARNTGKWQMLKSYTSHAIPAMMFLMLSVTAVTAVFNLDINSTEETLKTPSVALTGDVNYIVTENVYPQWTYDVPLEQELIDYTVEVCHEYGLDPAVIFAIMQVESGYNPNASNGYCFGLMQINECNYGWLNYDLGITDLLEPKQNIMGGCYILSSLWHGSLESALVCYNTGSYGASSWYSQKVLSIASSIEMVQLGGSNDNQ